MVSANLFVLLVIQLFVQVIYAANECQFTSDCGKVEKCIDIQDTSCVCKFGECVYDGNPFFRNNECSSYTDCACSRTPDSCFCRVGTCENVAWECRTERDCNKLNKCKSKDCRCSTDNTCEPYDCYSETDCYTGEHYCSTLTDKGYSCKCSKNMCAIVKSTTPHAPPASPSPPSPSPPPLGKIDNKYKPYDCHSETDCYTGKFFCSTLTDQGYSCKCSKNVCETARYASPLAPPASSSLPSPGRIGDIGPPLDIDGVGPPLNLDAFGPPLNLDGVYPPAPPPLNNDRSSEEKSCSFSDDCKTVRSCIGIQDAACVCKRGQCIPDGNPFFRGNKCNEYTDCGCKNDPMNCFCRNGVCVQENWECHEKRDCNKMRKCKSVDCRCSYNDLCEPVECTTTQQCINQGASCVDQYEGYTCKCEKNVCGLTPIVQRY